MAKRKKIFFTIGSVNQTSQMHQIAQLLPDYDCYFSQFYSDSKFVNFVRKRGWLDNTIMGGKFKKDSTEYLKKHGLKSDFQGKEHNHEYDLSILCTDLIVPKKALNSGKTIWVQEGMVDKVTTWTKIVKWLKIPRYLTMSTSLNGSSSICDIYCCASEGYKEFFTKMGTSSKKILVTGIPNYDNLEKFKDNDFPHNGYVMVATSDIRELSKKEDRVGFIKKCVKIAKGRQLLFKLHPNENEVRAIREIKENTPADTLIYTKGDTNEMVANAVELITQWSTVVYVGIAFGIPVHSFFKVDELMSLAPLQNGGTSAKRIADLARAFIEYKGKKEDFLNRYKKESVVLQPGKNQKLKCPEY